jgi:hypothetical protein
MVPLSAGKVLGSPAKAKGPFWGLRAGRSCLARLTSPLQPQLAPGGDQKPHEPGDHVASCRRHRRGPERPLRGAQLSSRPARTRWRRRTRSTTRARSDGCRRPRHEPRTDEGNANHRGSTRLQSSPAHVVDGPHGEEISRQRADREDGGATRRWAADGRCEAR